MTIHINYILEETKNTMKQQWKKQCQQVIQTHHKVSDERIARDCSVNGFRNVAYE